MINEKLKKIKLVITDVDGVITDRTSPFVMQMTKRLKKVSMYAMDLVSKC